MNNENNSSKKLIEEWDVDDDDQILWIGIPLAFLLVLAPALYAIFIADDDDDEVAATVIEEDTEETVEEPDEEEPTTAATQPAVAEEDGFLAIAPALAPLAGDITGERNGNEVTLTGFVANDTEKDAAGDAALALDDVDSVNNELAILEPEVTGNLDSAGVVNAAATGEGTVITVTGSVANEADRDAALAEAESVEGVTEVIDQLTISAVDVANTLPQVEFATGSAEILETSFDNLRQAAEILSGVEGTTVEVQGYTDTVGDEAANQTLSQNRADAVRSFLIDEGVPEDTLTAVGFGETTQFAEGDTAEAYAENRKVLFATQ